MDSYEQGRRKLDGAMRTLSRIIDREPKAPPFARSHVSLYLYYVTGCPADRFLEQWPPSPAVKIRSPRKISRPRFRVQRFSSYSLQRVLDAVSQQVCQQG
jgi:hypothetical protein